GSQHRGDQTQRPRRGASRRRASRRPGEQSTKRRGRPCGPELGPSAVARLVAVAGEGEIGCHAGVWRRNAAPGGSRVWRVPDCRSLGVGGCAPHEAASCQVQGLVVPEALIGGRWWPLKLWSPCARLTRLMIWGCSDANGAGGSKNRLVERGVISVPVCSASCHSCRRRWSRSRSRLTTSSSSGSSTSRPV